MLADAGFHVFPVEGKEPRVRWGSAATRDAEQLLAWWRRWPDAGVAVDCGRSGVVVVDLDVKDGVDGVTAWKELADGRAPATFCAVTPSGGRHLYYRDSARSYRNSASQVAPGVDVRGVGGYVVAPPSPGYAWHAEMPLSVDDLPALPDGLLPISTGTNAGHWRRLDLDRLDHRDRAALAELLRLGGHSAYQADGYIAITRPGRMAGLSASIGHIGPGVAKVFTPHWPPLTAGGRYSADDLVLLSRPDVAATVQPALAAEHRILDKFGEAVAGQGLVGEDALAKLLYLTVTSRLLDRQVSAGVKGHSASGKSWTVEVVLRFFPRDAYLTFTAMSEKALIHSDEEYAHRTIVIYEVVALREGIEDDLTSYLIRSLLSEGRIEYPVTVRDPKGGFTTKTIVKEGPTNLLFTTTKTRVHAENETRVLSLNTDDSTEQTARVFLELANDDAIAPHGDLDPWIELQRWLENQDNRVVIPYARDLVARIPAVAVRLRRDVGALLSLIRTHALLHQATRRRDHDGRLVATLDDYGTVRDLVADILSEGVGATVSATVRGTVGAVATITTGSREASALDVARQLGVDKSNAGRRLRAASDGGYVRNREDKHGKPGRWVLGDPLPEAVALLPTVEELRSGCAVAPVPGAERDPRPASVGPPTETRRAGEGRPA
nr:bifunctional DNA primase/polymerase [Nocardioides sp. MAH-18]